MKIFFGFFILLSFVSCTNNADETNRITDSSTTNESTWQQSELGETPAPADRQQYFIWEVNAETKSLQQNPQIHPSFYNADTLIVGLNERYPQIRLQKTSINNDTLYAKIEDASYLTNQMGSFGSEQYLAQAVLNLTAVPGINYVRIDFEEGSHASPDVWTKKSFSQYVQNK